MINLNDSRCTITDKSDIVGWRVAEIRPHRFLHVYLRSGQTITIGYHDHGEFAILDADVIALNAMAQKKPGAEW